MSDRIGIPPMQIRRLWVAQLLSLCLLSPFASAEDRVLTIEGTRILGDQESPTVLYLIPWQPPAIETLDRPGGNFMIDRSLRPLERASFQRLLSYHRRFPTAQPSAQAGPAGSDSGSGRVAHPE